MPAASRRAKTRPVTVVRTTTEDGLTIGFQRVKEANAGRNRLHLDRVVDDLDEATAEVEKPGGRWLEPGKTRQLEGFRWRSMADPEGNEFDIDVLPADATASLPLGSSLGRLDQSGPEPQPGAALA